MHEQQRQAILSLAHNTLTVPPTYAHHKTVYRTISVEFESNSVEEFTFFWPHKLEMYNTR